MKRTFIAIPVEASENLLKTIAAIRIELSDFKIRWVDPSNFHITLAFLGNTDEKLIPDLISSLNSNYCHEPSFQMQIKGADVFRDKAVWLGIDPSNNLQKIKTVTDNVVSQFGFIPDARPFRPHLTIGRPKTDKSNLISELLIPHGSNIIEKQKVEEVLLFESILKPDGPIYNRIGEFKLTF
jgi:RNA 2',3'-cyclic 3'-phosphodiesterase